MKSFTKSDSDKYSNCRSREGAWIEILNKGQQISRIIGRSREGAWIEIALCPACANQKRSRSREGAWIEIMFAVVFVSIDVMSLPRGSVD